MWGGFGRVDKATTPLDGDAVRSKITDFRTALYPRQYHPCVLENPLFKRIFAYKEFFRRTCRRKNENAADRRERKIWLLLRQTDEAMDKAENKLYAMTVAYKS